MTAAAEAVHPPEPEPTELSAPHWQGCTRGELLVQQCRSCERHVFPPTPRCAHCLGDNLVWVRASGRGVVYSYTVVWRPQSAAFEVPYAPAVIEIEEGCAMFSRIVGCAVEQVAVGMPVRVSFRRISERTTLPEFTPEGV